MENTKLIVIVIMIVCMNHAQRTAAFSFDTFLSTGMDMFGGVWNQLSSLLSDSFSTIKEKLNDFLFEKTDDHFPRRQNSGYRRVLNPRVPAPRRKQLMTIVNLGYRLETHIVLTQDGYILNLHRVLPTGDRSGLTTNKTALLHHGLLGSSVDWLLAEKDRSLPYLLSSEGYDVWLANARGNDYSNAHLTKKPESDEFWDFTFQDMGQYDLPAVIDYIRRVKKENIKIDFVGYSMGSSAFLVLTSTMPRYQEYIHKAVLLAPLAYMIQVKGPLKMLATIPADELDAHGIGEFFASRKIPKWMARKYCNGRQELCTNPIFFLTGIPKVEEPVLSNVLKHVPAGGSTKTVIHYAKLIKNGLFTSFRGSEFPIGKIGVPVFLISAHGDMVASVSDVSKLATNLAKTVHHHVVETDSKDFAHTDFMWSNQAQELVFKPVIEYLKVGEAFNSIEKNEIDMTINE